MTAVEFRGRGPVPDREASGPTGIVRFDKRNAGRWRENRIHVEDEWLEITRPR